MSNLQNPIRIYENDLALVGEMDNYSSAYFTRSWYGVGEFSIQINFNSNHSTDLQKGRIVSFGKDLYRVGIITKIKKELGEDGKGSQIVTATGYELPFIFSWRIIDPQSGNANYVISNDAETVMKTLVNDLAGPGALASKQFPGLTIGPNLTRGENYVLSGRYATTVAEELQKCSLATGLGYFIHIDEIAKTFIFETSLGLDRTASQSTNPRAIFSDKYDTIKTASITDTDSQYRNFAYVAGQGVGDARTIRQVYSTPTAPTGFDLREFYIDARDLSTLADLDARAAQKLGELNIQTTIDGMPLTYSPLVYRQDYDLGDIVTIDIYGTPKDARITAVKESWAPLTYDIDVIFDKEPASLASQVSTAVSTVKSSLAQTEGRMDQGIQTTDSPTFAGLHVDGFTSLGGDTAHPAIKIKVIEVSSIGSTQSGSLSYVYIGHSLTRSKILSVAVFVTIPSATFPPNNRSGTEFGSGYGYQFFWNNTSVVICNINGDSANILSNPATITITYME